MDAFQQHSDFEECKESAHLCLSLEQSRRVARVLDWLGRELGVDPDTPFVDRVGPIVVFEQIEVVAVKGACLRVFKKTGHVIGTGVRIDTEFLSIGRSWLDVNWVVGRERGPRHCDLCVVHETVLENV